jgi:semaphorin 6
MCFFSIARSIRNAVYNVTIGPNGLKENTNQRIEWKSTEAHQQLCSLKGKQEFDCQNYIRVFARLSPNQIMICGTNSYKPLCRYYNVNSGGGGEKSATAAIEHSNEIEAPGKCPYSPTHNSTYIYTGKFWNYGFLFDFTQMKS